jgi:hypothetical protein
MRQSRLLAIDYAYSSLSEGLWDMFSETTYALRKFWADA